VLSPYAKSKLKEWGARYLPAELLSVIVTMIVALLVFDLTGSQLTTAVVGTWVGSGVYFGYILAMDIRFARRQRHAHGHRYTWQTFGQNIRALFVEFGVAELVDLLIIRPALMYYLPIWMGSLAWGTLTAKLAADLTFYAPAIVGYEISKRWLREFR
jgi:hypothetical protein